jgi:hypothetical protein
MHYTPKPQPGHHRRFGNPLVYCAWRESNKGDLISEYRAARGHEQAVNQTKQATLRAWPVLGFLSGLTLIYAVPLYVVGLPEFDRRSARPFAVTLDLTLMVPALYYFLLVRRAGVPILSIVPVFIVSVLVAAAILPDDKEGFLALVEYAGAAAELFLIVYVVRKALGFRRRIKEKGLQDPVAAIRCAFRDMMGDNRVVRVASTEATILYLALFSWRRKPTAVDEGIRAFSYHQNSGWASLLPVLGFFMMVELFFVHILLARWNAVVAWTVSGLGIYGLIWLLGDYRAMCLRPVVLGPRTLSVRVGLRWETEIPLRSIERVWIPSALDDPPPGYLNAAVLKEPSVMIGLKDELTATGLFGVRRGHRTLGLSIDEQKAFRDMVDAGIHEADDLQ